LIFNIGSIILELLTGRTIKKATQDDEIYRSFTEDKGQKFWSETEKRLDRKIQQPLKDLICRMLSHNPNSRPRIEFILKHEWMNSKSFPLLSNQTNLFDCNFDPDDIVEILENYLKNYLTIDSSYPFVL